MTKWDYLRDFHALHPEVVKNPRLSFEAAQADARRVAAQSAEQEYQNQRKKTG